MLKPKKPTTFVHSLPLDHNATFTLDDGDGSIQTGGGIITITVYTGGLTVDFEGNECPPIILEADQTVTIQVEGEVTFSGVGVVSIGTLTATVTHINGLTMVEPPVPSVYALERSHKQYELTDQLGNV